MGDFDASFAARLIEATACRPGVPGSSGTVELAVGKTKSVAVVVVDGRVTEQLPDDTDAAVRIQMTGSQREAWLDGRLDLAVAFMKGDLKPVGETGSLVAALEILDDRAVVDALR